LQPEVEIERITTFEKRKELLLEAGADTVVKLEPTPELLSLEPEAFIEQLVRTDAPDYIVEGAGFQFGKQRKGSIQTLHSLGEAHQFECIEVADIGTAIIDGTVFIAAISVGTKPTFGSHARICEAHLIGFDGEIGVYEWPLTVTISHWIREQVAFDSIESLTIAIEQDIQSAIKLIESI
jgi:FAD synthase